MIVDKIWQYCYNLASKAHDKSHIYKQVFNDSSDAQSVLGDLANFCGATDIDLRRSKDGTIDPIEMGIKAGKLMVYQHICKLLSMTEAQKNALAMRYYELQTRQKKEFE